VAAVKVRRMDAVLKGDPRAEVPIVPDVLGGPKEVQQPVWDLRLHRVYGLSREGRGEEAIDRIFEEIDELLRAEHLRLAADDECYALREYIPRGGFRAGETNSLILNLKKHPARQGQPDWKYKLLAIQQVARELRGAINSAWLQGAVIVPMPPSRASNDPEYDDRMVQVAHALVAGTGATVRELIVRTVSRVASHSQEQARDVDRLLQSLGLNESVAVPEPAKIGVIDDVLTTGAHFRAARYLLQRRFPSAHIVGFFAARRIIVDEDSD